MLPNSTTAAACQTCGDITSTSTIDGLTECISQNCDGCPVLLQGELEACAAGDDKSEDIVRECQGWNSESCQDGRLPEALKISFQLYHEELSCSEEAFRFASCLICTESCQPNSTTQEQCPDLFDFLNIRAEEFSCQALEGYQEEYSSCCSICQDETEAIVACLTAAANLEGTSCGGTGGGADDDDSSGISRQKVASWWIIFVLLAAMRILF